jgi:hypothetical protein
MYWSRHCADMKAHRAHVCSDGCCADAGLAIGLMASGDKCTAEDCMATPGSSILLSPSDAASLDPPRRDCTFLIRAREELASGWPPVVTGSDTDRLGVLSAGRGSCSVY